MNTKTTNRFLTFNFWFKLILIVSITLLIYQFLKQGQIEIPQLINRLITANKNYLLMGVLLSFLFIFFQGEMYFYSFKTVQENITRWTAIELYLKRNFVSVFLPVGSISSLATFSQNIENQGVTKLKMSLASAIYLIVGVVSLWMIAIPVLYFTAAFNAIDKAAYYSLVVLTGLLLIVFLLVLNIKKKKKIYQLIIHYFPKYAQQLNDLLETPMNIKALIMANLASIGLEIIGILILFISIYSIGLNIHWLVPCLAYTIATLILYIAPIARGVGAIELSLIYILTQNGIDANSALTVTLIARFFSFWLPLILGTISFIPFAKIKNQN